MALILVLKKDNSVTVVRDWIYPFPPTTYYHHLDLLKIEIYEFDYLSKDERYAYYKLLS